MRALDIKPYNHFPVEGEVRLLEWVVELREARTQKHLISPKPIIIERACAHMILKNNHHVY